MLVPILTEVHLMTASIRSVFCVLVFFAQIPAAIQGQSGTGSPVWTTKSHTDVPRITARFPALNIAGRQVGYFDAEVNCTSEFLHVRATLVDTKDYEIVQIPKDYANQVPHRSQVSTSLNGGQPQMNISVIDKENVVEVEFIEPGFDKISDSLKGFLVLTQKLNGNKWVGQASDLYLASSFRMDVFTKHSGSPEYLHLTIQPREPSFQAFVTSCQALQPGHESDLQLVLEDKTSSAAKLLSPTEATQLRSLVSTFEEAVRNNNLLAMNEGPTRLNNLMAFGPEKRCLNNDKRACDADDALSDVSDAMSHLRGGVSVRRSDEKREAGTLADIKAPLTFVFSDQTQIGAAARGEVVALTLKSPLYKGKDVAIAQGAVAHFLASVFASNQAILNSKDLTLNGTTIPLRTTQCTLKLMDDPSSSPFKRQPRDPSQPPFHAQPRAQAAPQRTIAAGSTCAVTVVQPIIQP